MYQQYFHHSQARQVPTDVFGCAAVGASAVADSDAGTVVSAI